MEHSKSENFKYCNKCGLLYNKKAKKTVYNETYFNDEYENQYGTSYIDDKSQIQKKMLARLKKAEKYIGASKNLKLLDIGSAAGFFLEIGQKKNYSVEGWEISSFMAKYANKNGLKTKCGEIQKLYKSWQKEKNKAYDIVSAFYVIEHMNNQDFLWKMFSNIIKPEGLLLLTLPSYNGPMYRFHFKKWEKTHPKDHFVDYSNKVLKNISKNYGFKPLFIKPDSLHPERFPFHKLFSYFYKRIQNIFCFSDTIYAVFKKCNNR